MARSERIEIRRKLRDTVERHDTTGGKYPKADAEVVIQSVVDDGHDREQVEDVLEYFLRVGELYETGSGELGVV